MFDVDAYLEALDVPVVRINGRDIQGRLLSLREFMPYAGALQKLARGEANLDEAYGGIGAFCRQAFPKPWWRRLFFRPWVTEWLMALPPMGLVQATRDFLKAQAAYLQLEELQEAGEASE